MAASAARQMAWGRLFCCASQSSSPSPSPTSRVPVMRYSRSDGAPTLCMSVGAVLPDQERRAVGAERGPHHSQEVVTPPRGVRHNRGEEQPKWCGELFQPNCRILHPWERHGIALLCRPDRDRGATYMVCIVTVGRTRQAEGNSPGVPLRSLFPSLGDQDAPGTMVCVWAKTSQILNPVLFGADPLACWARTAHPALHVTPQYHSANGMLTLTTGGFAHARDGDRPPTSCT